jgi:sporulation-control protein spo0M
MLVKLYGDIYPGKKDNFYFSSIVPPSTPIMTGWQRICIEADLPVEPVVNATV